MSMKGTRTRTTFCMPALVMIWPRSSTVGSSLVGVGDTLSARENAREEAIHVANWSFSGENSSSVASAFTFSRRSFASFMTRGNSSSSNSSSVKKSGVASNCADSFCGNVSKYGAQSWRALGDFSYIVKKFAPQCTKVGASSPFFAGSLKARAQSEGILKRICPFLKFLLAKRPRTPVLGSNAISTSWRPWALFNLRNLKSSNVVSDVSGL
mmetsp:Transcript_31592/g.92417  ORF Transcript_31592/g.92417 Transcript_31592/m.92417 type:complete len:211 (-) Transcript_31592:136-768(-)